ncbi:molybdopterin-dependent oxidoreductase [Thalassovita sp.]|uniref:molybdopterin-dependent oxidoreductase n=1 Tax=Thalassovita sp. TaxID=1979401 RepID=UPI0029DE8E1B|nr:molybdopterin-dependent oxidoreductase [Thalassovita sp.]
MQTIQPVPQIDSCKTTCPYCGVGCGVLISPDPSGGTKVKPDPDHPANLGRLCSKGTALAETIWLQDRLLHPQVNGVQAEWDDALDLVAQKFKNTIAEHGPDSVAFYVSGQLLTEDYYVANKLMKGFIGSANIDTNSRLCMASTVAGHKRAFGTDTVPGQYTDLEQADLVVLTGSNLAWCHPVLYQRLVAAKKARPQMKVVNIDPRRTATSDIADMHLAIAPGGDVALFNRLLVEIHAKGALDARFVAQHVEGLNDAINAASGDDAKATGLTENDIAAFCNLWIGTEKVVTVFSQGVNQSSSGADKVNAILNCHLATGRIGQPGCGPFSVTGQPNAMGGREVGGLANMLACHLDLENAEHRSAVKSFWSAPEMPETAGLKAVGMFDAVGKGQIKALWIMCTNPVVSMPDADAVKAAIEGCDFVVVSDLSADTDTARLADVVLPATGWGEKDGTVTNSERCISRQRGFLPAPGAARHDWDIIADVGRRMGWGAAFDYQSPSEIFREYATLSGIAGQLGRDFDISGLATISDAEYDLLQPTRWPVVAGRTGGRFFGDGRFFTPSGKARMLPVRHRAPMSTPTQEYPFRLNTGRIRDQWHTMTRTAKSPRLSQHLAEPFLEIHPKDAAGLGISSADIVQVTSPQGKALLRALVTDRIARGQVFAPMHWTAQYASAGRVDVLVAANTDPVSGQPESKASVVHVQKFDAGWYGFAVSLHAPQPDADYWAQARSGQGWRIELAAARTPADWESYARSLLVAPDAQLLSVMDPTKGSARIALIEDGQLVGALFVAREPVQVARNHMAAMLGDRPDGALAGRPGADRPDPGATVCACFNVGVNTILAAIEAQKLLTVDQIGAALNAGTNCGSCRPELAALLASVRVQQAAE